MIRVQAGHMRVATCRPLMFWVTPATTVGDRATRAGMAAACGADLIVGHAFGHLLRVSGLAHEDDAHAA
eukprot:30134-Eustigmatos_ZCMA.PRE.2